MHHVYKFLYASHVWCVLYICLLLGQYCRLLAGALGKSWESFLKMNFFSNHLIISHFRKIYILINKNSHDFSQCSCWMIVQYWEAGMHTISVSLPTLRKKARKFHEISLKTDSLSKTCKKCYFRILEKRTTLDKFPLNIFPSAPATHTIAHTTSYCIRMWKCPTHI